MQAAHGRFMVTAAETPKICVAIYEFSFDH
jgi:hypothetical protein